MRRFFDRYKIQLTYVVCIICVILIPITYYTVEEYNVFFSETIYDKLKLQNATLENMHLENNTYVTDSNDGSMAFANIDKNVQNVVFYIDDCNFTKESAQIYFDYGNGFNENDSISFQLKKGKNLVKVSEKKVYSMRFDPTISKDSVIIIDKIELNYNDFKFQSLLLLPIFIIFLLIILHKSSVIHIKSIFYIIFMYLTFKFVYRYDSYVLQIILICIMLCSLKLIEWYFREVREDEG